MNTKELHESSISKWTAVIKKKHASDGFSTHAVPQVQLQAQVHVNPESKASDFLALVGEQLLHIENVKVCHHRILDSTRRQAERQREWITVRLSREESLSERQRKKHTLIVGFSKRRSRWKDQLQQQFFSL